MSASSYTDWQVECDGRDEGKRCGVSLWASELSVMDATAATVRKRLKGLGWAVNIVNPEPDSKPRRLDFCPDHKPDPGGTER